MHRFASFNRRILPVSDIRLNPISNAGLYGRGVFTTLAVHRGRPFLWEKHWRRLKDNADRLGIGLKDLRESDVFDTLLELIERNGVEEGRARLTFFDGSTDGSLWSGPNGSGTDLLIQTADRREVSEIVSACLSPYPVNSRSPLAGIKSCNYLENLHALRGALRNGFAEAVRCNERNEVASFCTANMFWLEHGRAGLFTPSLKTGCLAGTTRELVLERCGAAEVEKDLNDFLRDAEAIFLTSAGRGVAAVSLDLGDLRINSERPHGMTALIARELEADS